MLAKQVASFVRTKICQFGAVLSGFCGGFQKVGVFVRTRPQSTKKIQKNPKKISRCAQGVPRCPKHGKLPLRMLICLLLTPSTWQPAFPTLRTASLPPPTSSPPYPTYYIVSNRLCAIRCPRFSSPEELLKVGKVQKLTA